MSQKPEQTYNASSSATLSEPLTAEEIALRLYMLLDDCDTADDIAKSDDRLFRELVREAHRQRFKYATTEGYDLKFNIRDADSDV